MKKNILFNLILLISFAVNANTKGEKVFSHTNSKEVGRSFAVTNETSVEIINKYGDITVNTWNKDSVRFEISITAEAQKMSQVQTLLEMVEIKFTSTNSMVVASLGWGGGVNAFKKSAVEMTLAAGATQMLRINYTVYMPEQNTLKIENRFGNILLPQLKGKVYIDLNHGNLKAGKINKLKSAVVKYGDVDINEIKSGEMDILFGDILIESADEVFIKSASGSVEIESVNELDIEGKSTKVRIESVNDINADLLFSDLRIRKLSEKMEVKSNLGDIDVRWVADSFRSVSVDAAAGDVSLTFSQKASFGFDLYLERSKSLVTDKLFVFTDDDKTDNFRNVEGKLNEGTSDKLTIHAKNCSVTLETAE